MASGYAETHSVGLSSSGTVELTLNLMLIDSEQGRVDTNCTAVFNKNDTVDAINSSIRNAITAKVTELGMVVDEGTMVYPCFNKM